MTFRTAFSKFQFKGRRELFVKGAMDRLLEMCIGYLEGDKNPVKLSDAVKERIMETSRSLGSRGLRGTL